MGCAPLLYRRHGSKLKLKLNTAINFLAVNGNAFWSPDAEAHLITLDTEYKDLNVIPDANCFADAA